MSWAVLPSAVVTSAHRPRFCEQDQLKLKECRESRKLTAEGLSGGDRVSAEAGGHGLEGGRESRQIVRVFSVAIQIQKKASQRGA